MRRIAVLVISISLMVTAIAGPSQAVAAKTKITKPSAPTIVSVTSSKPKKGKVNVTVKIGLPASNGGSKITGSKVSFAGKSCTMKNAKTSCTIKGISDGKSLKIVATSKNKKGFGAKSKTTRYTAGSTQLRFNIKNAAGIALSGSNRAFNGTRFATNSSPKLLATSASGQVTNAVSAGSASINKYLIAPNGNLFVLFEERADINGMQCLLAEVIRETGLPICIDGSLEGIDWDTGYGQQKPIQFDASGAIYYKGWTWAKTGGKTVLRKYNAGIVTDLISEYVTLYNFLVLPSGSVLINGVTKVNENRWTRLIDTNGSLQTLFTDNVSFIETFADGNAYLGFHKYGEAGVKKFNVSTNLLDQSLWIGYDYITPTASDPNIINPVNGTNSVCRDERGAPRNENSSFCHDYGSAIKSAHNILGGKTYIVSGGQRGDASLVQVFPVVSKPQISIVSVSSAITLGSGIIVSGLNSQNQNTTTYFNSDSGNETVLIPTSNEIEIYHMTYNAATNKLMFDGLRFADNQYVFGQVDLGTNQVNVFTTLTSKWDDFQGFQ